MNFYQRMERENCGDKKEKFICQTLWSFCYDLHMYGCQWSWHTGIFWGISVLTEAAGWMQRYTGVICVLSFSQMHQNLLNHILLFRKSHGQNKQSAFHGRELEYPQLISVWFRCSPSAAMKSMKVLENISRKIQRVCRCLRVQGFRM